MIGEVKKRSGSYVAPMLILAVVNTGAVLYFAVLLRYLPAKSKAAGPDPQEEAAQRLVNADLENGDGLGESADRGGAESARIRD
jgi:hypothetical protein